ncbi:MAG: membrane protein insertase YidC [Phycisphaeraceae bacterium]|nr:membrane protein insertase YidC [Phycisphaeraceae bacterium]
MPRETNTRARIFVPIVVIALAALVVVAVLTSGGGAKSGSPAPADAAPIENIQATDQPPTQVEPAPAEDTTPASAQPALTDASGADQSQAEQPIRAELTRLRPRPVDPALDLPFTSIGGGGIDTDFNLKVEFTPLGAGVESITLTHEYTTVQQRYKAEKEGAAADRYVLQRRHASAGSEYAVASLAAHTIEINGAPVSIFSSKHGPIWRQTSAGDASAAFEAVIENEAGDAIVRITRAYSIRPGANDIHLEQRIVNLTDAPLDIRLYQYGPVDLPSDNEGYGGDKRRVRFGRLLAPAQDPSQRYVESSKKPLTRRGLVRSINKTGDQRIWPTDEAVKSGQSLAWSALTNRYFAFAVHAPITESQATSAGPIDRVFHDADEIWAKLLWPGTDEETLVLQLNSKVETIQPGEANAGDFSLGAYAGPIWERPLRADPVTREVGLDKLVIYNFGGPCAFCTFQPLARLLLWFLETLHNYVVFDWAVAILILVFCVRLILHPVTKKSQISLQRFSKQMQALAPKQKKLQEKYKDDPKRLQQEMATLMREEGVNFTGALGCLPMFLQSPVWIALYAMLFFAFDLRQEPGFYGIFQTLTGGTWNFLGDLSAPDGFISFGRKLVTLPMMGDITSINILPLLLGIVFFLQQKYLTPPPSASMTPEQQSQQKMIRVLMVVMFPVIMYNAPSGLALYFCTNSTLGILESRHIRAHIDQLDLENKPGAGGRKKVANRAASPFGRDRDNGSKFKQRKKS